MKQLLEELYKARQDSYYRMCLIKSVTEKAGMSQNQLDLIECLVKESETDYLEVSDRYHTALYENADEERRM